MGLFSTTVLRVTGKKYELFDISGLRLLNSARIVGLKADGSGSMFSYALNHPRGMALMCEIKCADSAPTVAAYAEEGFASKMVPLTYYPNGVSGDSIQMYLNVRDVVVVQGYNNYSSIHLSMGKEVVKYLVKETLSDILELVSLPSLIYDI